MLSGPAQRESREIKAPGPTRKAGAAAAHSAARLPCMPQESAMLGLRHQKTGMRTMRWQSRSYVRRLQARQDVPSNLGRQSCMQYVLRYISQVSTRMHAVRPVRDCGAHERRRHLPTLLGPSGHERVRWMRLQDAHVRVPKVREVRFKAASV